MRPGACDEMASKGAMAFKRCPPSASGRCAWTVLAALHSSQRAATARALAGSAAIAMIGDQDRVVGQISGQPVSQMQSTVAATAFAQMQTEHLIEVAVVEKTLPVDRQQLAAHDVVHVFASVHAAQQRHVVAKLALADQGRAE